MYRSLETSIVRVFHGRTTIVGIGFLIEPNFVLTCSHTINNALNRSKNDAAIKPDQTILIDFPFVQKETLIPANVLHWFPKTAEVGDLAVLVLQETKPTEAKPVVLKKTEDYAGHGFKAYGCPENFQKNGRWVDGKLQSFLPNGQVQAVGTSDLAYFLEHGFSGGPVWDEELNGVVGIVQGVDTIENKLQALILPTNSIMAVYPQAPVEGPVAISYAPGDAQQFANKLRSALESKQFEVYMHSHSSISGSSQRVGLHHVINESGILIVILSPGAIDSKQVESEWDYALGLEKRIVPILIKDCEVPPVLAILDPVDFRDGSSFDVQLADLSNRLRKPGYFQAEEDQFRELLRQEKTKYPKVVGQRPITTVEYFQNRYQELSEIGKLLSARDTRLVSLIGSGGIGKTAIAGKFLYDLEKNIWPESSNKLKVDGILYLSHREIIPGIGGITLEHLFFGCTDMLAKDKKYFLQSVWTSPKLDTTKKVEALLQALSEGFYVVLLDNIEDLLDQDGNILDSELSIFLQMSFTAPKGLRLLVTSREPLFLLPKDAPLDNKVIIEDGLDEKYGVAMLRQADPSGLYGFKDAAHEELAEIVRLVHGLPRALEIFVGIKKKERLLTLNEVKEQFFRHGVTVKELIEEGYRRLDSKERMVLQGLAVFSGPVPITAVTFLLGSYMPNAEVENIILHLINIHMIQIIDKEKKLIGLHPIDRQLAYSQIPT